jgi:uncharacterized protein
MFGEIIDSRERLREIMGEPNERVTGKVIDHLDGICRRFIAASPYAIVGSIGADGLIDLSPKGDPAGFVHVLDDKHLVIPDRLGNRRADTFEALLTNPAICVFFMIPGYTYTLRVAGQGLIARDERLQQKLAVDGKPPQLLLVVRVEEAFMHCAKSMARAGIWQPDRWPDTKDVPSLAEAMVAHGRLRDTREEMQSIIDSDFDNRMY